MPVTAGRPSYGLSFRQKEEGVMETQKFKICPAIWFSGFFGLGALVHFVRFILRFPLVVGNFEVSLNSSLLIAVVLGALSAGLLYLGCHKPCCKK
jgi:hypothetical protein